VTARSHSGRLWDGRAGTGIEVVVDETGSVDETATLGMWFVHCPDQSPGWDKYIISVIHLRTSAGPPPPVPHASHELVVVALDPTPEPTPDDPGTWRILTPINVTEQFEVPSDAFAVQLLELAVQAVLAGWLWAEPPLSGQVEPWRSAVIRTSAHFRGEVHACGKGLAS
jgi:hypothetical protein